MSRPFAIALSLLVIIVAVWLWRGSGAPPAPTPAERPTASSPDGPRSGNGAPAAGDRAAARHQPMEGAAPRPSLQAARLPTLRPDGGARGAVDPAADDDLQQMIRTATEDPDPSERAAAIRDLSLRDDVENVIPVLRQVAKDPDPDVKLSMVMALSELGEAAPIDLLAQYASDRDPEIRLEALSVVEVLAEEETTRNAVAPIVNQATHDPDEDVRDKANEIAEQMSDEGDADE